MLACSPYSPWPPENMLKMEKNFKDRFWQLQTAAVDIPVQLVPGAEVLLNESLVQCLNQEKLPTINGGRYLLTEFPQNTKAGAFEEALQAILSSGYIPLIAHPERYAAVCAQPEIVANWLDLGCHLQLTGGSVLGHYGKNAQRAAAFLLKNDLVACIASDAHGVHLRSNFLLDVWDHLAVRYSKQYAQCLLYETPWRICHNEDL